MAEKLERSKRASFLIQTMMRTMAVGLMALTTIGTTQATAAELTELQYDEQTRSLTLILPESVTPQVSVLAPDQLLLELPDTQVGDLQAQSIQDGLVESIVLEQATPETTWIVMEFAAGTVLSDAQSAVPVGGADNVQSDNGEQAWQVRPALTAASRRVTNDSVTGSVAATPGASASSLRSSINEIAQAPDFSELPVLEPAVPMNEPVSVPPLNRPVSVPPFEAEPSVVEVEVIPTPESDDSTFMSEPTVIEEAQTTTAVRSEEAAAISEPLSEEPPFVEPPFLDDVETGLPENTAERFESEFDSEFDQETNEPQTAEEVLPEPIFLDLEVADETTDEEIAAVEPIPVEPIPAESNVFVEETAENRVASGRDVLEADEVVVPETTIAPTVETAPLEAAV
ncbi:MAG: hypothetical protein AAFZ17_21355, partial [Cyanobacteria bacterium J06650_10]